MRLRTGLNERQGHTLHSIERIRSTGSNVSLMAFDFRKAYDQHVRHVWLTLRRLGVPERDLDDATHEVFVVLHRRQDAFDATRPLRPWLSGIAYRVAADTRKRAYRRHEQTPLDAILGGGPADPSPGPDAQLETRQAHDLVHQALEGLDLKRRIIFVMHELDELPCPAIAAALDLPLNTVYTRLRAARAQFAQFIRRTRLRSQPVALSRAVGDCP